MPRKRGSLEIAAGKLVSSISKEFSREMGQPGSEVTERVMNESHRLLQAAKEGSIAAVVGTGGIVAFLGLQWVNSHSSVKPYIEQLEQEARLGNRPNQSFKRTPDGAA